MNWHSSALMTGRWRTVNLLLTCTKGPQTLDSHISVISPHRRVGAQSAKVWVVCQQWTQLTSITTPSITCSAAGRAGSGRTATEESSVLGCPAPPCWESSRQLQRPLHLPPLLQPHIAEGISFLAFSSCAPIRNLAGLFKDCFVKYIILKGIIQFSTDHSHQEFIKAAWPYQSSREGMQEIPKNASLSSGTAP